MNLSIINIHGKKIADAESSAYAGINDENGPIAGRPVAIMAYELSKSPLPVEDFCKQYADTEEEIAKLVSELKEYIGMSNETGIGDSKKEEISKKKLTDACDPGYDEDLYAMSQEFMNSNKSLEEIVSERYEPEDVSAVIDDLLDFMDATDDHVNDSRISDGFGDNIKSAWNGALAGWRNNRKYLFKQWLKGLDSDTASKILSENPKILSTILTKNSDVMKKVKGHVAEMMQEAEYGDKVYKPLTKYGLNDIDEKLKGTLDKEAENGGLATRAVNGVVNKGKQIKNELGNIGTIFDEDGEEQAPAEQKAESPEERQKRIEEAKKLLAEEKAAKAKKTAAKEKQKEKVATTKKTAAESKTASKTSKKTA